MVSNKWILSMWLCGIDREVSNKRYPPRASRHGGGGGGATPFFIHKSNLTDPLGKPSCPFKQQFFRILDPVGEGSTMRGRNVEKKYIAVDTADLILDLAGNLGLSATYSKRPSLSLVS